LHPLKKGAFARRTLTPIFDSVDTDFRFCCLPDTTSQNRFELSAPSEATVGKQMVSENKWCQFIFVSFAVGRAAVP
jgi:hypothetical protein